MRLPRPAANITDAILSPFFNLSSLMNVAILHFSNRFYQVSQSLFEKKVIYNHFNKM